MAHGEFFTVAKVGEIPAGGGRMFRVAGREIAVFLWEGRYYALDDCCPHAGASLHTGELCDGLVICDRHRWAFRLDDGRSPDAPTLRAPTYEARVESDEIQVRVPRAGAGSEQDEQTPLPGGHPDRGGGSSSS